MNTTANCLIEIGTEELPPTALKALSLAFEQGLIEGLKAHNLNFNAANVKRFATPRRLAVLIPELDTQQADQAVEKLGPAVAAAFDKEGKPRQTSTPCHRTLRFPSPSPLARWDISRSTSEAMREALMNPPPSVLRPLFNHPMNTPAPPALGVGRENLFFL